MKNQCFQIIFFKIWAKWKTRFLEYYWILARINLPCIITGSSYGLRLKLQAACLARRFNFNETASYNIKIINHASIAQSVEQRFRKPQARSSILLAGSFILIKWRNFFDISAYVCFCFKRIKSPLNRGTLFF